MQVSSDYKYKNDVLNVVSQGRMSEQYVKCLKMIRGLLFMFAHRHQDFANCPSGPACWLCPADMIVCSAIHGMSGTGSYLPCPGAGV